MPLSVQKRLDVLFFALFITYVTLYTIALSSPLFNTHFKRLKRQDACYHKPIDCKRLSEDQEKELILLTNLQSRQFWQMNPTKRKKMKKLWLDTDLNANTVQEMILTTRTNKKPTNIYKGFAFAKRKRTNLKER